MLSKIPIVQKHLVVKRKYPCVLRVEKQLCKMKIKECTNQHMCQNQLYFDIWFLLYSMMPILHTLHSAIFLTKIYESSNTPCLSAPAESTPETSPVKIWLVKPLLAEKRLNFHLPDAYYIVQFTPVEILDNWYSPVIF